MVKDDHEGRLSRTESDLRNIGGVVIELKDWMKTSSQARATNHNEIIQRLTANETKLDEFKNYQSACDQDRQKLTDRVVLIERNESRQSGKSGVINAVIAATVSGLITFLVAIYGKIK